MSQRLIHTNYLAINDVDVLKLSLASSGTAYLTKPIPVHRSNGYSAVALTSYAGTALINISYQLSLDQGDPDNWFTASTTDGTTLTAVGAIASSVTAATYIVFTPRPANWLRFSITATSTGTWSMQYVQQEDGA